MKKITLKTISLFFAVGVLMTSCLGDTNQKISTESSLVYIQARSIENKTPQLARVMEMGNMAITDPLVIQGRLDPNEFYYLGFKTSTKDGQAADNVFNAQDVRLVGDGDPLGHTRLRVIDGDYPVDYKKVNASNMSAVWGSVWNEMLDDNWVFRFTVDGNKDNDFRLLAIYNRSTEAQSELTVEGGTNVRVPLEEDQYIIDLYLEKEASGIPAKENEKVEHVMAVDLSAFRGVLGYSGSSENGEKKIAKIKFRFFQDKGKDKDGNLREAEEVLLGTWSLDSGQAWYGLAY